MKKGKAQSSSSSSSSAPVYGKDTQQPVYTRENHISCYRPPPKGNTPYEKRERARDSNQMVQSVQWHKCNFTCFKYGPMCMFECGEDGWPMIPATIWKKETIQPSGGF